MTNRSLSVLIAGVLLFLMSVFLIGFFIGQRTAAQQFIDRAGQGVFADHIYAAMCGLSGVPEEDGAAATDTDGNEAESDQEEESNNSLAQDEASTSSASQEEAVSDTPAESEYYAQLVGFGTAKAAQDCVKRLKKKGFPVFVQKRHSRTAKGRLVTWYQVVTENFHDEEKLQAVVARLEKEEKLQGIHVVAC